MILRKHQQKLHKVKVIACSYFGYWYSDRVGDIVYVREVYGEHEFYLEEASYRTMQDNGNTGLVKGFAKNDCKILETWHLC